MDVAGFVIAIFALIFSIIALGLAMRALYIIGVNAGLDKKVSQNNPAPVVKSATAVKKFKDPIRRDGNKIIYNEEPLIYVIEDIISEEECQHFVN